MLFINSKNVHNYTKLYKFSLLICFIFLISTNVYSESFVPKETACDTTDFDTVSVDDSDSKDEFLFIAVDQMAEFPGGDEALIKFIQENVKYPAEAKKKGIEGTVYVTFVVNKEGKVENVKLQKGIDPSCDEEALRVISTLPQFIPGKQQNGKPVSVLYNIPVKFKNR